MKINGIQNHEIESLKRQMFEKDRQIENMKYTWPKPFQI